MTAYTVSFWGARGSVPTPGPQTARYGGNTSCVSLSRNGNGEQLVILDAGTGVRPLGNLLMERRFGSTEMDLLLSHTHWDHIQGLPFFTPLAARGYVVRIWGAKQGNVDLPVILQQQMHPVVFPVPLDELATDLTVEHIEPGLFQIDGFEVSAMRVRHPASTMAYRLTPKGGGTSIAFVPDNELGPGGDYGVAPTWREEFVEFLADVDVLIHDAMFAEKDLEQFRGWGHSSPDQAVLLAAEAKAKQLVMFHHRPEHDDDTLDALLDDARTKGKACGVDVVAAFEGMEMKL